MSSVFPCDACVPSYFSLPVSFLAAFFPRSSSAHSNANLCVCVCVSVCLSLSVCLFLSLSLSVVPHVFILCFGLLEDRRWRIGCRRVDGASLTSCGWTDYRNSWDGPLQYQVPLGRAITGVASYHSNTREDRRWKLHSCKVWRPCSTGSRRAWVQCCRGGERKGEGAAVIQCLNAPYLDHPLYCLLHRSIVTPARVLLQQMATSVIVCSNSVWLHVSQSSLL